MLSGLYRHKNENTIQDIRSGMNKTGLSGGAPSLLGHNITLKCTTHFAKRFGFSKLVE